VVLYYDDAGHRRYHTLGAGTMTKPAGQGLRDEFMRTVNGSEQPEDGRNRPVLLREFMIRFTCRSSAKSGRSQHKAPPRTGSCTTS